MIPSREQAIILHGNPEHAGIRLMVLPLLASGLFFAWALVRALTNLFFAGNPPDYTVLLNCLVTLPLGLGLAALGEAIIKRHWHSGVTIVIDQESIRHLKNGQPQQSLRQGLAMHALRWSFRLRDYPRGGRERRVASDWYCLSCQLGQDEERIIVFSFVPPREAQRLMQGGRFHPIDPAEVYDTSFRGLLTQPASRPKVPGRILAGEDGRYWVAEQNRWREGIELNPADLETLLQHLPNLD